MLAIFSSGAGKTGAPNNGICIIAAGSIWPKPLPFNQRNLTIPIWAPKQKNRSKEGDLYHLKLPWWRFLASSAAPSGDAGNGNHTPAARLFHAHVYTSNLRYQHSLKPRNKRISAKKSVHVAFQCRFRAKNRQIRRGMGQKTPIFSFNGKIWA